MKVKEVMTPNAKAIWLTEHREDLPGGLCASSAGRRSFDVTWST